MLDYFNPRCLPEWTESDLRRHVASAFRNAKSAPGEFHPQNEWTPDVMSALLPNANTVNKPVPKPLLWDRKPGKNGLPGELKDTIGNCLNYFKLGRIETPTLITPGRIGQIQQILRSNPFCP